MNAFTSPEATAGCITSMNMTLVWAVKTYIVRRNMSFLFSFEFKMLTEESRQRIIRRMKIHFLAYFCHFVCMYVVLHARFIHSYLFFYLCKEVVLMMDMPAQRKCTRSLRCYVSTLSSSYSSFVGLRGVFFIVHVVVLW